MMGIIILVCSMNVLVDACDKQTATDIMVREVPFGNAGFGSQVEVAEGRLSPDAEYYVKIETTR